MKVIIKSKRFIFTVLISSLAFTVLMLLGAYVYNGQNELFHLEFSNAGKVILYCFINFISFVAATVGILFIIFFAGGFLNRFRSIKNPKYIWYLLPLFIIAYSFVYFVYFPGIAGYDVYMQLPQAYGDEPLTSHHPVLHTLFIRLCLAIGSKFEYEGSTLVIYSVIQIVLFSVGITYAIYLVYKEKCNIISLLLTAFWYAVYPTFALFSFNFTKDVLFAVLFNLFSLKVYYLIKNKNNSFVEYFSVALLGVFSCLFRNNAVYIIGMMVIMTIILKIDKKVVLSLALSVVTVVFINGFIFAKILNIPGAEQEKLSIPIQQIAVVSVFFGDEIDKETNEIIEDYLPEHKLTMNPSTVDFVKVNFNTDRYKHNKLEFWKIWIKLGIDHPMTYVKYGLLLNLESWFPYYEFKDQYYYTDYINTNLYSDYFNTEKWIIRTDRLPEVKAFYDGYSKYDLKIMQNKLTGFVFSCSFPFLYLCQIITQSILFKKNKIWIVVMPFILLWVTYLFGPLCNIRYFLPILLFVPLGIRLLAKENS